MVFKVSIIWKIIKTMYGEEYLQNSLNTSNREDGLIHNNLPMSTTADHNAENEQKTKGISDTKLY